MANNENLIPIPGRLHSVATEGHVSGADEIYDDTQQKDQETINSEQSAAIRALNNALQAQNEITASFSEDGKIYYDFKAGDIFYIVQNGVRKYRVAYFDGTADEEHPVTIDGMHFYFADNASDAIFNSSLVKNVSTDQQQLTPVQKSTARENIAAVAYEKQELTSAQQVQLQNNMIGKEYAPADFSGLGKKVFAKNMQSVGGVNKNIMTQAFFEDAQGNPLTNTVFVIQYDYELAENITIPNNSVLQFEGGSISGTYTITGQNTGIQAGLVKIFSTDATLAGTWEVVEAYPEWFGAKGDGVTDDTIAIQKLNGFTIKLQDKTYLASNLVFGSHSSILGSGHNSVLKQKDNSSGDFITFENWDYGTFKDVYVEGGDNISEVNYEQALVKIRTTEEYQVTQEHYKEFPIHEGSSWHSNISNVIIQHSEYNGISYLGNGDIDNGKNCWYNWIINTHDIYVNNCKRYCIFNNSSDNRFSNINASYGGLVDIVDEGSSCVWVNIKIDGEGGYLALNKIREDYSYQTEEEYYNRLMISDWGCNFLIKGCSCSLYSNIDMQSSAFSGLKVIGVHNCAITSIINNGSSKTPIEYKRFAPALYLHTVTNSILNISFYSGVSHGQAQLIKLSEYYSPSVTSGNIFNLTLDGSSFAYLGEDVTFELYKLQKYNIVNCGSLYLIENYPTKMRLYTMSKQWYIQAVETQGTVGEGNIFAGEKDITLTPSAGVNKVCNLYYHFKYKKDHVYLATCVQKITGSEHIYGEDSSTNGVYFGANIINNGSNLPTIKRMALPDYNKLDPTKPHLVYAMFKFTQDLDIYNDASTYILSLNCINTGITTTVTTVNFYDLTQDIGLLDIPKDINAFVANMLADYFKANEAFMNPIVEFTTKIREVSGTDDQYNSLYNINGEKYYYESFRKPYFNLNGKLYDANGFTLARSVGVYSQRPTSLNNTTDVGFCYFDTYTGKPIWWTGSGWIDATGTAV